MDSVPKVDLSEFVACGQSSACQRVAEALQSYGCLVVRDPRVNATKNEKFLDMMECYFDSSDGKRDARPELHYQVGVTPSGVENARNHCALARQLDAKGSAPVSDCPPLPDAKWRFFWRVGPRPNHTEFQELNAPQVVPPDFPNWAETMDGWGEALVATATTVAEMAAIGFGMHRGAIADLMRFGPHLLAPTGSDLSQLDAYSSPHAAPRESPFDKPKLGTVLASFHYDLNLLTVHGKSRFPGLTVWRRDGVKTAPVVPEGCLLVQAGKQLEILTGGVCLAGFHEVIANQAAAEAVKAAKLRGRSTWRVSSTCFAHVASDNFLKPLPPFDTPRAARIYKAVRAGHQVQEELTAIALGKAHTQIPSP